MGGRQDGWYFVRCVAEGVSKAGFMAAVTPFLLKTADNPQGVDAGAFEGMKAGIAADRPAFLSAFLGDFFNVDVLGGKLVSDQAVQLNWSIAAGRLAQGGGALA